MGWIAVRKQTLSAGSQAFLLAITCIAGGCGRGTPPESDAESVIWVPGGVRMPLRSAFEDGAVCASERDTWIAYAESGRSGTRILVQQVSSDTTIAPRRVAALPGQAPSIGVASSGQPPFVVARVEELGGQALVAHHGSAAGGAWNAETIVVRADSLVLAANRLVRTTQRGWLLPLHVDGQLVALTSTDGHAWERMELQGWPADTQSPAIVESQDNAWHGLASSAGTIVHAVSRDVGATWSSFAPIPTPVRLTEDTTFGVTAHDAGGLIVSWSEAPPDTGVALPGIWTLRWGTWTAAPTSPFVMHAPIAYRAGATIGTPALARTPGGEVIAWFVSRDLQAGTAACVRLVPAQHTVPGDARAALDLWAQHTLARPAPSQRLFIEGYCMRGFTAAHAVLGSQPSAGAWLRGADVERGVLQARSFADWMRSGQDANGYWPLGYKAVYAADMAAVVGVYAALAPYVDAASVEQWTVSARRFAAALERDGLLLANGACGVGWLETRERDEAAALREPYLVSTALAGIATHAWLYARTREPEYARRARAALDYTLAALQPDGSLPGFKAGTVTEGPFLAAAYVQEGWMAADRFLDDDKVRAALKRALPAHVDWLLRTQRADGGWGSDADGESARTVAIPNFLIWYDRRCESRPDVQQAIARAAAPLIDPDRWVESGFMRAGKHEDVRRALAGRTLAALASGEPVY